MARISNITSNILDSILPTYGNQRVKTPIWDEHQHMFMTDQYTSASGNTYYKGVRFSDRFATVLHIGLYHNWTYINEVELYVFDGTNHLLVSKTRIDKFYDEDLVRNTTEDMLYSYVEGQMKLNGCQIDSKSLEVQIKTIVGKSYHSIIDDQQLDKRLESIKPLLAITN